MIAPQSTKGAGALYWVAVHKRGGGILFGCCPQKGGGDHKLGLSPQREENNANNNFIVFNNFHYEKDFIVCHGSGAVDGRLCEGGNFAQRK